MLGQRKRLEPKLFYTGISLADRIPPTHPLRQIRDRIDLGFIRGEVAHLYGKCGNESIDPIVLIKLMLLLFIERVKSERALMEQMPYRLDWLWFCGYDLDEEVPNHSVLSKARRRWGRDVFIKLFQQVLGQCIEAGLVDGRIVHVDGSLIRADASMDTLQPDLKVLSEKLYCQLEQSAEETTEGDPAPSSPSGKMISPTDPDARMTRKNGKTVLGYKEHRVVDDAHGIVTATITTDASVDESHVLTDVLDQHRCNSGSDEQTVVADKGYGPREVYKAMHRRGTTPCIPHQKHGGTHGTFASERFTYDQRRDEYICPAGHRLKRKRPRRVRRSDTPVRYHADAATCRACPLRHRCTKNSQGRTAIRDPEQWYVEWADGCGSRRHRRWLQGRRRVVAEGSFADASNNHGHKRARWRRLWRMEVQNLLISTVQNLRKLIGTSGRKARIAGIATAIRSSFMVHIRRHSLHQTVRAAFHAARATILHICTPRGMVTSLWTS
jgi:transposase